jgi:predicted kinase
MCAVVILIGFQGAGKTTFCAQRFAGTHTLVSKDRLRNNRRPERRQRRLIEQALAERRSVVVDNTNASAAERAAIIAVARAHEARMVGYFFESPLAECRRRNDERPAERRVPDVGIFATAKRFERPRRSEGFDELWSVRTLSDLRFDVSPYQEESSHEPR